MKQCHIYKKEIKIYSSDKKHELTYIIDFNISYNAPSIFH